MPPTRRNGAPGKTPVTLFAGAQGHRCDALFYAFESTMYGMHGFPYLTTENPLGPPPFVIAQGQVTSTPQSSI